jgi:hypothetical protein
MAAFTLTNPQPGKFGWILNGVSADISACEELKATPGVGLSIVVDHITINNGAGAQSITIGQGESGPGSVETALIGPIAMAVNTSLQWDFPQGMVLTANKSLTADSTSNTAVCIFAYGRIE